jgi:hypothetical protein
MRGYCSELRTFMKKSTAKKAVIELSKVLFFGLFGYILGASLSDESRVICHDAVAVEHHPSFQSKGVEAIAQPGASGSSNTEMVPVPGTVREKPAAAQEGVAGEGIIPVEADDLEERIRDSLSPDESVVSQENEMLERESAAGGATEHLRTLTEDERMKYVRSIAENRDDASIVELRDLILNDDEAVRHIAIDTLIEIMDQETGHYDDIEAVLVDNSVFMDDAQMSKFTGISSRVGEKEKKE